MKKSGLHQGPNSEHHVMKLPGISTQKASQKLYTGNPNLFDDSSIAIYR